MIREGASFGVYGEGCSRVDRNASGDKDKVDDSGSAYRIAGVWDVSGYAVRVEEDEA